MQGTCDGILIQISVDKKGLVHLSSFISFQLLYRLSIYSYLCLAIVNLKKSFITCVELDKQCTDTFKNCIAKSF